MAFTAEIVLDEISFDIKSFSMSTHRNVGAEGRTNTRLQGGIMNFSLELGGNTLFHDWLFFNRVRSDGSFIFYQEDGTAERGVFFEDAYCVSIDERFQESGSSAMLVDVSISARLIRIVGQDSEIETEFWPTTT